MIHDHLQWGVDMRDCKIHGNKILQIEKNLPEKAT